MARSLWSFQNKAIKCTVALINWTNKDFQLKFYTKYKLNLNFQLQQTELKEYTNSFNSPEGKGKVWFNIAIIISNHGAQKFCTCVISKALAHMSGFLSPSANLQSRNRKKGKHLFWKL